MPLVYPGQSPLLVDLHDSVTSVKDGYSVLCDLVVEGR